MGYAATITSNNQITLPKYIREFLGAKSGDTVTFTANRNTVTLHRTKTAKEVAEAIDSIIPEQVRDNFKRASQGKTATEIRDEWLQSDASTAHYQAELERTL